ncbi:MULTISPECIES: paraquat-inducible protein A [unclassified Rhizobium]|uniref:paraquat-inducible protein A n=1 Tax=unclassified Rhizobium TaxID=2613769 RepID=UPI00115E6611|nr:MULTISPECIES: paraquat-inducible protein A [unclassified Rhizobium]MBZ5758889.1 paraquat-inducible protein A [Rhizobium sp. VS19-DR96]MBZ5764281.1 paraquat-inducible protein A [Rhizobium sp. VS19-DR129.2]MBZ5771824.1 paraquat-inducible protein A [Rhizobium sp. VS19-DRK62.2]MBZ5783489.1 paraquat-inducible protein A [Rhizobium sp. VS19-DR121]MBZ5800937.1 paraquat-inducible protein A [Rhizobium sp. VS19-DR181]
MDIRSVRAVLLIAAPFFLALGLVLPLVRFDRLYFFSETPSLLAIVASLWQSGNVVLSVVVAVVSIGLPIVKLVALAMEALSSDGRGEGGAFFERVVPQLSRWSMMDVMLVAIVIAAAKTSGLASAFTQPGLWFYAGSTIISGLLHFLLRNGSGPKK